MIYLGSDHGGFALKEHIKQFLIGKGYDVKDEGAHTLDPADDYPDFIEPVAKGVQEGGRGILFCGSAEGVCIGANKFKGIRAVPVHTVPFAKRSREHNDSNVLCLAGGATKEPVEGIGTSFSDAEEIVVAWLETPFSTEERHRRRVKKMEAFEK